ncbi:dynein regulatory complex protein 9-like, partial [Salvelinus namaycush]|uniref:Dynein regulatory complex protein 9 n=1 Tax=Salvelinus namaycush TaxID=8040 RepID=A0A8U0QHV3_SALNM
RRAAGRRIKALQRQLLDIRKEKTLELQLLQERLEEERRVHMETGDFPQETSDSTCAVVSLDEKLEVWMERYERDMEDKQQELNSLRNKKANNLSQLQELAKKYRDIEQVVIEDRMEKEALRRKLEKEHMERDAATKIQSWWRGTLVRRGLSPYKKGKKPKSRRERRERRKSEVSLLQELQ